MCGRHWHNYLGKFINGVELSWGFEIRTCVSALDLLDVHLHGDSFHRQIGAATNKLKGECTGNRSTIMSWTSSRDVQRSPASKSAQQRLQSGGLLEGLWPLNESVESAEWND